MKGARFSEHVFYLPKRQVENEYFFNENAPLNVIYLGACQQPTLPHLPICTKNPYYITQKTLEFYKIKTKTKNYLIVTINDLKWFVSKSR